MLKRFRSDPLHWAPMIMSSADQEVSHHMKSSGFLTLRLCFTSMARWILAVCWIRLHLQCLARAVPEASKCQFLLHGLHVLRWALWLGLPWLTSATPSSSVAFSGTWVTWPMTLNPPTSGLWQECRLLRSRIQRLCHGSQSRSLSPMLKLGGSDYCWAPGLLDECWEQGFHCLDSAEL